jgi:hypothetical protein
VPSPIDHILIAVVLCIGFEILERKLMDYFRQVNVHFGNSHIKISCCCEKDYRDKFDEVISSCYVLNNLKFEIEVNFMLIE